MERGGTRDVLPGSAGASGACGELEFTSAAVGEREFIAQCGELFSQPLVLVERHPEPDADRFISCALAHRQPCWCRLLAALPFDVGAQVGVGVEELAADARPRSDERERDRLAFALELDE